MDIMSFWFCNYVVLYGKSGIILGELIIKIENFLQLMSKEDVRKMPCRLKRKQIARLLTADGEGQLLVAESSCRTTRDGNVLWRRRSVSLQGDPGPHM